MDIQLANKNDPKTWIFIEDRVVGRKLYFRIETLRWDAKRETNVKVKPVGGVPVTEFSKWWGEMAAKGWHICNK